jgi:hypothetical protein
MTDARATGSWLVADELEGREAAATPEPASESGSGSVQREVVPGFYAGTSKGSPPPMRNTRKLMIAVGGAAVAVAVIGGGVAALQGDGGGSSDESTPIANEQPAGGDDAAADPAGRDDTAPVDGTDTEPPADPAADAGTDPATDPAGGDGTDPATPPDGDAGEATEPVNAPPVRASQVVEVTDQGWYVAAGLGSYGFTVVNTSDQTLGSFVVAVKAYDQSGRVISGLDAWRHVVGTLQPYQQMVVTDLLHSESQAANGIGRMEFEVTELTTSDPGVRSPNDVPPGSVAVGDIERTENIVRTTVSYRVASTYELPLDANVYLVFRNGAGHIVGGARSFIDLPAEGSVAGDFEVPTLLVSPDATKVEVYVAPQLPL